MDGPQINLLFSLKTLLGLDSPSTAAAAIRLNVHCWLEQVDRIHPRTCRTQAQRRTPTKLFALIFWIRSQIIAIYTQVHEKTHPYFWYSILGQKGASYTWVDTVAGVAGPRIMLSKWFVLVNARAFGGCYWCVGSCRFSQKAVAVWLAVRAHRSAELQLRAKRTACQRHRRPRSKRALVRCLVRFPGP